MLYRRTSPADISNQSRSLRLVVIVLMLLVPLVITTGCPQLTADRGERTSSVAVTRAGIAETRAAARPADSGAILSHMVPPLHSAIAYTGHDVRGIPYYARRTFSAEERKLLRAAYGVENPNRLYVSDSTPEGVLKYDTQVKRCAACYVNSYRVGFVSIRQRAESWDQLERRVHRMTSKDFPPSATVKTTSLSALDPDIRADVKRMLADARRAGFRLATTETYRSPEREAYLMMLGGSRTHTLTSLHSYGRAVDVAVDDANPTHGHTRADWIAFRRWISGYRQGEFRFVGAPDRTWDWPHVSIPSSAVGFRSIGAALARAQRCLSAQASGQASKPTVSCDFEPHLPIPLLQQVRP